MAKVNKHGMKMVGLKKASGSTEDYDWYDGRFHEIFYDKKTGEVWAKFQYSDSWTVYHDENIVKICNTTKHLTMQRIADLIYINVKGEKPYDYL